MAAARSDFSPQDPIHSIGYQAEIVVRFSDGRYESTAFDSQIVGTWSPWQESTNPKNLGRQPQIPVYFAESGQTIFCIPGRHL